jgi:hypothetical protein
MGNCSKSKVLPTGPKGQDGNNGQPGGIFGKWIFSTSTIVAPSINQIRFNNTTSNLVTNIYISDTGRSSVNYGPLLDSFTNSGNYGNITIYKEFDSTKFWIGKITNVVDNGTYHTLTVTYISSSEVTIPTDIFLLNDNINLTFSAGGVDGSNGLDGVDGLVTLSNQTTGSTTTVGTNDTTLLSYTVNGGRCSSNQDSLLIISWVEKSNISDEFLLKLNVNGTTFASYLLVNGCKCSRLRSSITREGATTYFFESINSSFNSVNGGLWIYGPASSYASGSLTFANDILIEIKMQRISGNGTATAKQLNVNFLNKE